MKKTHKSIINFDFDDFNVKLQIATALTLIAVFLALITFLLLK